MTVAVEGRADRPPEPATPVVEVFGIRHHGPGSARSLVRALDEFAPDIVLIEGPADADPLLEWVTAEGMEPPLALLAYAPERTNVAAFWPFAVFSPEWQAMTWARRGGIDVAFCDLPAALSLGPGGGGESVPRPGEPTDPDGNEAPPSAGKPATPAADPAAAAPAARKPATPAADPAAAAPAAGEPATPADDPRTARPSAREPATPSAHPPTAPPDDDPLAPLGGQPARPADPDDSSDSATPDPTDGADGPPGSPPSPAAPQPPGERRPEAHDPLAILAATAGYDDAERWWDDLVESRRDGSSPFPEIADAMAELRDELGPGGSATEQRREARREAYMRQTIRSALRRGHRRVAVVCGAWHAPVLRTPLPPASRDATILRGLRKRKVTLTWVPWTHERLASNTGYGAGVTSPGWYAHLWSADDRPISRWLTAVARSLRRRDVNVSSAHVIEAVRLAETLAALRGRPLAGLTEVTDATRAVLCEGDELAVRWVSADLVVGQALGTVAEGVPTVPLEADLVAIGRTLRVRREATPHIYDLDLRKPNEQTRSRLFHRLRLLDITWIQPARSGVVAQGTFRETWRALWRPECSVEIVAASVWGVTVVDAATARVADASVNGDLPTLTSLVERCLLADLPDALSGLLEALADRAALDADLVHLMDALPALSRAQRYGDVRGTDTTALREVAAAMVVRICAGLVGAVTGLDDEGAAAMRTRLDGVNLSIGLLADEGDGLRDLWLSTLVGVVEREDLPPALAGRLVRVLLDAAWIDDADVRLQRALSHGASAATKAGWVDGFFTGGGLLLIHDHHLRALVDEWVAQLDEQEFVDLLPLIRRTFSTFSASERRSIAGRLASSERVDEAADVNPELGRLAVATVRMILGLTP